MQYMREYIERRSIPVPECGCWIWEGSAGPGKPGHRYGDFHFQGRHYTAHRASYEAFKGSIPPGMQVLHSCDTTLCVNPAHLSVGTNQENIEDSVRKGRRIGVTRRRPRGLKYRPKTLESRAKVMRIQPADRLVVKELAAQGMKHGEIAARYNVSVTTIYNIAKDRLCPL
jgi:uncharacterized protein YeaO (DUF488 family)